MTIVVDQVAINTNGEVFYNTNLPTALREANKYSKNGGLVLSMPQLVKARLVNPSKDLWSNWFTANSEEDVVTDLEGRFGKKNSPVLFVVHGNGILSNPDRIDQAYKEGLTPQNSAKFTNEEANNLLQGKLLGEKDLKIISYSEFKKGIRDLPVNYAVVLDFNKAKETKSDHQNIEGLYDNPLVIARAGGVEQAKLYLDRAKEVYNTKKYGNWHPFNNIDPTQAQGRLLCLGGDDGGFDGSIDLSDGGWFVGVAPEALVAQKKADKEMLEARVQTALDAKQAFDHNGTLYVPISDSRVAIKQ